MILQLLIVRVLGLPIWWYGLGFWDRLNGARNALSRFSMSIALRVWVQNLFVPMYGDTSFVGRSISFVIRLIMIVVRGFAVLFFGIILLFGLVLYLILPPLVLFGVFYHAQSFI